MKEPPEKSTKRELAEKAIEAGAGLIPIVGSPLATVFAYMVSWSHNERMKLWLEDLAHAVDEMQETLEELTDDDVFLDAVVNATRAAQATHQREKLDALRNGVVHSVGSDSLNRPGFDAPSVMCERPVGRHGLVHSSRLRLRRVGVGRGGA